MYKRSFFLLHIIYLKNFPKISFDNLVLVLKVSFNKFQLSVTFRFSMKLHSRRIVLRISPNSRVEPSNW